MSDSDTQGLDDQDMSEILSALDDGSPPESTSAPPTSARPEATPSQPETSPVSAAPTPPLPAPAPTSPAPAPTPAPAEPPAFALPPGGQPFQFRVDGQDVALDGAVQYPEGVFIPQAAWDRQLRPNYLGARGTWREREQQYTAQLAELREQKSAEQIQGRALLEKITTLLEQGPEAVADFLTDFERNKPILLAEARAKELEARLQQREQQEQQRAEQQQIQDMVPRLRGQLGYALDHFTKLPELSLVASTDEEKRNLLDELWTTHGERLFWEADRDYPEYGYAKGQILVHVDNLRGALEQKATLIRTIQQRERQRYEADARNKAVLTPTGSAPSPAAKPAPTPVATTADRNPDGTFKKKSWKDEVLEDDFSDVFTNP